jgi:hypothetical protein
MEKVMSFRQPQQYFLRNQTEQAHGATKRWQIRGKNKSGREGIGVSCGVLCGSENSDVADGFFSFFAHL